MPKRQCTVPKPAAILRLEDRKHNRVSDSAGMILAAASQAGPNDSELVACYRPEAGMREASRVGEAEYLVAQRSSP
jgi:hypothetical protein